MESTVAILLRKRKFSDTSLIVSWCTESLGCIQTVAKGARRAKSPFAGKLDLFFEAELARIAGVHDANKLKADPAFALGNLFGKLPLSRTPLLKTLVATANRR